MADVFQTVGAALAIVELSLKAYHHLSTFISAAKVTNQVTSDLFATVQRFKCTLSSVKGTINIRIQQLRGGGISVSKDEADIYTNLEDTLRGWQDIVNRFMSRLRCLRYAVNGIAYPSWTDQLLAQLELDRKAPIIIRFEASMSGHMAVTSLLLNCLKIYMQATDHEYIDRKLRKIERLQQRTNDILAGQNWDDDTNTIAKPLKKWRGAIITSKSVSDKFSAWTPDTRSLADRDRDSSELSLPLQTAGSAAGVVAPVDSDDSEEEESPDDEEDLRDPKPEFDDSYPQELLDALIKAHDEQIDSDEQCDHLEEAEANQRRLIEYLDHRQQDYGVSYNKDEQIRRLARLLRKRRKFSDSGQLLVGRLNEQDLPELPSPAEQALPACASPPLATSDLKTIQRDSDFWYDLAETRHAQWQAEENEPRQTRPYRISFLKDMSDLFAKRAFKLRLHIREDCAAKFEEAVELLQAIWESQGAVLSAATLRSLYPSSALIEAPPSPGTGPAKKCLLNAIATGNGEEVGRIVRANQGEDYLSEVFLQLGLDIRGDNPENIEPTGASALFNAIARGDFNAVQILLEHGADVNQTDAAGQTPVMLAAQRRDGGILASLCNRQPNLEARDKQDKTALHHALHGQGGCEAIRTLLQEGADATIHCCELGTPLHDTIVWAQDNYAQLILDSSSNTIIEALDRNGQTPLHLAVARHRYKITKLLLRRGAILDRRKLPDRGNVNLDFKRLLDSIEAERADEAEAAAASLGLLGLSPELNRSATATTAPKRPARKKRTDTMSLTEFAQKQKADKQRGQDKADRGEAIKRRSTSASGGSGGSGNSTLSSPRTASASGPSGSAGVGGVLSRMKTTSSIKSPLRGWGSFGGSSTG